MENYSTVLNHICSRTGTIDYNAFWTFWLVVATCALVFVTAMLWWISKTQIGGLRTTYASEREHQKAEFIYNFSKDFFTLENRIIMMLIDYVALRYEEADMGEGRDRFGHFVVNKAIVSMMKLDPKDLSCIKGIYSAFEMDDLLGHFDDIGLFQQKDMIDMKDVCCYFGWYITKCWENAEIQKYLQTQKNLFQNFAYIAKKVAQVRENG